MHHIPPFYLLKVQHFLTLTTFLILSCSKEELNTISQVGKWTVTGTYTQFENDTLTQEYDISYELELDRNFTGKMIKSNGDEKSLVWELLDASKIKISNSSGGSFTLLSTYQGEFEILQDFQTQQRWEKTEVSDYLNNGTISQVMTKVELLLNRKS